MRLMQGEVVEPEQTWNIPEVLVGLYKKKSNSYFDLDPEYRPNLDMLIFKTEILYAQFMKKMQEDIMANQIAQRAIMMGGAQPPNLAQQAPPAEAQPSQEPAFNMQGVM